MAQAFTQFITNQDAPITEREFSVLTDTKFLKLVHIVLPKDTDTGVHDVDRSVVVTCLRGKINFRVGEQDNILSAKDCIIMTPKESHNVIALEDSEVLVAQSVYNVEG